MQKDVRYLYGDTTSHAAQLADGCECLPLAPSCRPGMSAEWSLSRAKRTYDGRLALHRVRSRLVGQRTGLINQIRGFLIERGITVRQGVMPLRKVLPDILSSNTEALSPRMVSLPPPPGTASRSNCSRKHPPRNV
jgi:hypothetical protein